MAKKENLIQEKSFNFALIIIELYKKLITAKEYVLSKPLLRSGTSIGANIEEALAGQTKKKIIAKMSIASKETRETSYWLRLLDKSNMVRLDYSIYVKEINDIINIITAIVKTSQSKLNSKLNIQNL
ncbi:MAG TPA: four helix bundle protein [Ignavibacteriaceae bacterium]|nr:four helix bundle protein [Ignavibacteriaceae bacterium]